MLIFLIVVNHNFSEELDLNMKVGETKKIENISITFKDIKLEKRQNYNVVIGNFNIFDSKRNFEKKLKPEIRVYDNPKTLTFETAIRSNLKQDLYLTMSNLENSEFYNIKYQIKPLMLWIWLAALITTGGGLIRIFYRK